MPVRPIVTQVTSLSLCWLDFLLVQPDPATFILITTHRHPVKHARRYPTNRHSFSPNCHYQRDGCGKSESARASYRPTGCAALFFVASSTAAIVVAATECAAALTTPRSDGSIWMRHTPVCNFNENLAFDLEAPSVDLLSTTSSIPNLPDSVLSPHAAPCRRSTQDEAMRSDDVFKAAAFAGMANALSPAPVALQYSDWCV